TNRFSATVIELNNPKFWKVRPTPSEAISCGLRPTSSRPNARIDPSGFSKPDRQLNRDVLPAPLGPRIEKNSSFSTEKLMESSAMSPPNLKVTSRTSNTFSVICHHILG